MIGFEGIDVSGVRLHPVVIANHTKLSHLYSLVRDDAKTYLIKAAVEATHTGVGFVEPGIYFTQLSESILKAIDDLFTISGVCDWQTVFTPDDLVRIFLGTEHEPAVLETLNYPTRAKQTKQALDNGLSVELQALVTCLFMTEHGDFNVAKQMIEQLTPDQLEVIVATKTMLLKRAEDSGVKSYKHLAELAGVSEETAEKVFELIK
jgi:hypothetical protein